eukprot:1158208-Pelagomonas_calceolata.AAC.44
MQASLQQHAPGREVRNDLTANRGGMPLPTASSLKLNGSHERAKGMPMEVLWVQSFGVEVLAQTLHQPG